MVKFEGLFDESSTPAILAKGDAVAIPDAHFLFTADFSREGHDLLMTGEDGKTLLLVGYFDGGQAPDLVAPNGAILTSSVVESLAGPLAPGQYAQAGDQQPVAAIGKVVLLEGSATTQRTDGTVVELQIGDPVALGDVVQTGISGSLGLSFNDGSVFNLSAASRMVLDNLVYQPGGSSNAMNFNLVQGTFSFVAGQIAPTGEMNLDTPVATMGIRGTAGITTVYALDGVVVYRVIQDPGTDYTGAFVIMSRTVPRVVLATVNDSDLQWVLNSPTGIPTTEPADASGQAIINELIKSYNAATGNNVPLIKGENEGGGGDGSGGGSGTVGSGIDTGVDVFAISDLDAELADFFEALLDDTPEEYFPAEYQTTDEETTDIDDGSNPVIGNQPATFSGTETGDTVEDVGTSTGGTVVVDDPNQGEAGVQPIGGLAGEFGTFSINASGEWTYVLNNESPAVQALGGGETATDSFTVFSTDGSASITIVITVTGTNDVPVVTADTVQATEDSAIIFTAAQLLGNDTDVDGDTLTIASVASVIGGTAVLNPDGTVTFTPAANFNGEASFTYTVSDGTTTSQPATVTVNVASVNDAPVANPDTLGATEDTVVTYTAAQLLGNDSDADGNPLTIVAVTSGVGGTAVLNPDGTVTFTPAANFSGEASFTYTVSDGTTTSQPATVTVNVAPVNDAPVANPDTLGATEDTAVTYTAAQLLGNDTDADGNPLTIASVTSGIGGTVVLNPDGSVTFTPAANFSGEASFTYTVSDGTTTSQPATVTVNVAPVNDAPVANPDTLGATEDTAVTYTAAQLLGNDTDADGNPLTIASVTSGIGGTVVLNPDGTITFTPAANFNGEASFTYTVSDGTATSQPATVTVNVAPVNDGPVANPDTLAATEDTPLIYTAAQLLGNDTDADGNPLAIASVTSVTGGTAVLNPNGTVSFTPAPNFNGEASFTYTVSDGTTTSPPATVTVNVAPVNDAPVGVADTLQTTEDNSIVIDPSVLLANDTDVDNANGDLSIVNVEGGSGGSVNVSEEGVITFTPDEDFSGLATFTYQVRDPSGALSDPVTVTVNVTGENDPPVGVADTLETTEDTPVLIDPVALLANDSDVDNAHNTLVAVNFVAGVGGSIQEGEGGTYFVPDEDFSGEATFTYQVQDPSGALSDPVTVTVNVTSENDPPVGVADTMQTTEDTAVFIDPAALLANDSDVDNAHNTLVAVNFVAGVGGSIQEGEGGTYFVPDEDFSGEATFTYQVQDPSGLLSDPVTVTVNVTAENDAPVGVTDTLQTTEDNSIVIDPSVLLANDTDVDNANGDLSIVNVEGGSGGSVNVSEEGVITFTPDEDFSGLATFTYQVRDPSGALSDPVTVTVNVTGENDPPVGVADTMETTEDTPVLIDPVALLANDSDVDNAHNTLVAVNFVAGVGGSIQEGEGGTYFVPDEDFSGEATFTYQVEDPSGERSDPVTVTVNVTPENDAPVANDDTLAATEDTAITYTAAQLLGNDTDADGNPLTIASVTSGTGGTAVLNNDGTVTFEPTANYSGPASFTYTVSDGTTTSAPATVTINVAPVADVPYVAVAAVIESFEDGLAGWTTTGSNVAVESTSTTNPDYVAQDGSQFIELTTNGTAEATLETFLGLSSNALEGLGNGTPTVGSATYAMLEVQAGDVITFQYNFVTGDYTPFNDFAFVTIGNQVFELADVAFVENSTGESNDQQEGGATLSTGWQTYSFTVAQSGTLKLGLGVVDVGDARFDSYLLVDKVTISDSASTVSGDAGAPIPLAIYSNVTDPSETLSIVISGVPQGALLSAGTPNGDGTSWTLTSGQLTGLTMTSEEPGEFSLTVTAISTDGSDTAESTATIGVTVNGFTNFNLQSFSSDMSLMAVDTGEPAQKSMLAAPASDIEPTSTPESERREAEGRNASDLATLQTLAAAAGFTALGAQWAHAAHHEWNDKPDFGASNFDSKGDHEHGSPFAQFGKFERGTGLAHDQSKPDIESFNASPDGHGLGPSTLSDIIAQHFASLSGDDPAKGEHQFVSDKPPFSAERQDDRGREDDAPRSHAEKSETRHTENSQSEPRHAEPHHEAFGKGDGFGPIVDFSSLPLPAHGGEVGAKGLMEGHFKFGDLASMIDFSRDLLPNSFGPAGDGHGIEKSGGAHAAPLHHAAPPEVVHHVTAHDIVQNMSNDMDAATHHAH